jgi:hypothetical protein
VLSQAPGAPGTVEIILKTLSIHENLVNFQVFIVLPGALKIHEHFSGFEVLEIK